MIDVTKCIGCRKGIGLFIKEEDGYYHLDIFAREHYKCVNSDEIEQYLEENEGKGTFLPKKELDKFFEKQAIWWDTIIDLAYEVFERDNDKLLDFFNEGETESKLWNLSNEEIEKRVVKAAEGKGIEIDEELYSDLILYKK